MKEYRVSGFWPWFTTIVGFPLGLGFLVIAVIVFLASDPNSAHALTSGQRVGNSLIFALLGIILASGPWVVWSARLWLSDTGIKFKYRFRTREIRKDQVRSYSLEPGVKMGMIPLGPGFIVLCGPSKKRIARIPGYFSGRADLLSWLDKVTSAKSSWIDSST